MDIKKLYLATIGENAPSIAHEYGFGLEIDEFCTAINMDADFETYDRRVRAHLRRSDRFVFHAPFSELTPCAVDPLAREVSRRRLTQAGRLCASYGIKRMVIHSGFIPRVYFPEWYIEQASAFFRELLSALPDLEELLIENVLDTDPAVLAETVRSAGDDRIGLCLDAGHAHCTSDVAVEEWLLVWGGMTRHLHLHDNDGKHDLHGIPGTGTIGYPGLFESIEKYAPGATMTFECIDSDACVRALSDMGIPE